MTPPRHLYKITILEHHLDTFGHVNNANYLQIMEEARWDYITQNGYGLRRIQETGVGPVILEANLKFSREIRLREQITIETIFEQTSKKLASIHQKIFNIKQDICCTALFKFALFDTNKRRIVLPSDEWLKALGFSNS